MMKQNFIKISGGIFLVILLVLIYTAAVTQTSGLPKQAGKNNEGATIDTDTTDIGMPTGDDPWKELDNLVKVYYAKTGVFYQGTMKLIDANGDHDKVLEEKKFEFTCFQNEYHYSLVPFEVIDKKDFTVIVNHADKVVAVASKITESKKKRDLFSLADFKRIIEEQKANIKVTQLGNEKILTIDSIADPDIQGYRIYYSPQTYKISKMLVGMLRLSPLDDDMNEEENSEEKGENTTTAAGGEDQNEEQFAVEGYVYYVEINYSVMSLLSLSPGAFNPENKFVKIDGKKIELTSEFKEYELFNSVEP